MITFETVGRFERDSAIDRDKRAHNLDPPKTLLAQHRRYLKYKCSMIRNNSQTRDEMSNTKNPVEKTVLMRFQKASLIFVYFFV